MLLSLLLGTISSRWRGGAADVGVRLLTYMSWSVPAFLIAFFFRRWFTGDQTASSFVYGPQTLQHPGHPVFLIGAPTGGFVDWFQHMTLPAIALALGLVGVYTRYIRSSMLVALSQPYAVVARAKGLSEGRVVVRHALRNSLIPFVSALSLEIGAIVGASMAADWVFSMGGVATPDDRRPRACRSVRDDGRRDHAIGDRDRVHDARRPRGRLARSSRPPRGGELGSARWPTPSSS